MERSNFPHRNLDEDDEELLNGIWAGLETPDAFAQLQQMGVTVERPQVVMTADDGMRLVLENAARLERRSEGEVALRTETGE